MEPIVRAAFLWVCRAPFFALRCCLVRVSGAVPAFDFFAKFWVSLLPFSLLFAVSIRVLVSP